MYRKLPEQRTAAPGRNTLHVIECLAPAVAMVEDVGQAIAIMAIVPMSHELRTADRILVYRALTGGAAFAFVDGLTGWRYDAGAAFGCAVLVLHVWTAIGVG